MSIVQFDMIEFTRRMEAITLDEVSTSWRVKTPLTSTSAKCGEPTTKCTIYMIIFGLGIPAKHGQVGQAKPGFPHFADA
jgi:hypothetical protein